MTTLIERAQAQWSRNLEKTAQRGDTDWAKPSVEGMLTRMVGLTLETEGCQAPIGARCDVVTPSGQQVETEVVGFSGARLYLMPTSDIRGLLPNSRVIPTNHTSAFGRLPT